MQDGARLQAVIELLELFLKKSTIPFDRIVHSYIKERRYMGSKDRQIITEKAFTILRRWFAYEKSLMFHATPRLMVFYHEKKNLPERCEHGPLPLTEDEKNILKKASHVYYDYLPDELLSLFSDPSIIPALHTQPFVDLRVNTLKTTRNEVLKELGEGEITPYSPFGIRLKKRTPLNNHPLWRDGFVDIQDEGSQIASIMCDAHSHHTVLDLCAGAGGKTLALAAMMKNKGTLIATDTADWRLERAKERMRKAGVHNTQIRHYNEHWLARQKNRFDRVVIDAPCSGSGTWRRNPDLKIRTTIAHIEELVAIQKDILKRATFLVKPEGRIVYITCSVFEKENDQQVSWFLTTFPNFQLIPTQNIWEQHFSSDYPCKRSDYMHLTPLHHQTDGFFVAVFEKVKD